MSEKTIVQLMQEKGLLSDPPKLSAEVLQRINEKLKKEDVEALSRVTDHFGEHFLEGCGSSPMANGF